MRKFRKRVSNMLRAIGSFFRHPIQNTTTVIKKTIAWIKDPDLDVVGAGVIGSLVGRTVLYSTLVAASIATGMWFHGAVLAAVVLIDILIHTQTLLAIRRVMAIDAMTYIFQSLKPTLVTV